MNENLTKAKINLKDGTIELEGSEEFIQKNLDSFKYHISKPADDLPIEDTKTFNESTIQAKSTVEAKTPNDSTIESKPAVEAKTPNGSTRQPKSTVDNVVPEEFDSRGNDTIPSFRNFVDEKKPDGSAPDMIAVTGFYFNQYLKKEEFSEGNVMYAYGIAGAKRPRKVHQAFHDTKTRKQWIRQGSTSDKWILTHIGEDYVLHDLPKTKK